MPNFSAQPITANGFVTAQNRATLNFQTSGKLSYLPYKEGDTVTAGRTIARLDTYALNRQLSLALNNYRATRNTFDQTQQNSQDNVLKTQIAPTYLTPYITPHPTPTSPSRCAPGRTWSEPLSDAL